MIGTFEDCGYPNVEIPKSGLDLQSKIRTGQGQTIFTNIQMFRSSEDEISEDKEEENLEKIEFPELNTQKSIFILMQP